MELRWSDPETAPGDSTRSPIRCAKSNRAPNESPVAMARLREELLLASGMVEQAYRR